MLRILVVDHQIESCGMLASLVRRAGHVVLKSHSAAAAIEHLRLGRIDLVLLELQMPSMDGWQVVEWARSRFTCGELAVIGHSSAFYPGLRKMAERFGVTQCCERTPCTAGELRDLLRPYLQEIPMRLAA